MKKKKYYYAIVSKDDKRQKPAKIYGAFDYNDEGLKEAQKFLEQKDNKKLKIKKI